MLLKMHLKEIGRADLIEEDIDIGVALEFGVSTQTLLSLMEIGLSRLSAVALYEKIALDNLDRDDCVRWVKDRLEDLEALELPRLVIREIRRKILKEQEPRSGSETGKLRKRSWRRWSLYRTEGHGELKRQR